MSDGKTTIILKKNTSKRNIHITVNINDKLSIVIGANLINNVRPRSHRIGKFNCDLIFIIDFCRV